MPTRSRAKNSDRWRRYQMAAVHQIRAKFTIVVDFSVENDPDGVVFIAERLMTTREIDDGKPAKAQAYVSGNVVAGVVRAAVDDGIGHGFH